VLVNAPIGAKVERAFQVINNESGHGKACYHDLVKTPGTLLKLLDFAQCVEDAARLGTTDAGSTSAGGNRTSKRGELGAQPQSACEVGMIRIEHIKSRLGAWCKDPLTRIHQFWLNRLLVCLSFGQNIDNGVADIALNHNFPLRG